MILLALALVAALLVAALVLVAFLIGQVGWHRRYAMTVIARSVRALHRRGVPKARAVELVAPELRDVILAQVKDRG